MEIEGGALEGRLLTGLIGSGVIVLETSLVLIIFGYVAILVLISTPMGVVNTLWLHEVPINMAPNRNNKISSLFRLCILLIFQSSILL